MTESFDWDGSENTQDNTPKGLRSAYESMKAQNQAMKEQLENLAREVRTTKLASTFAEKGIPKQAADLFPKDVEISDDSVNNWLNTYGGLFAPQNQPASTQVETPKEPNPIAAPLDQMNQVVSGSAPAAPLDDFNRILADPNASYDDFMAGLKKMQGVT
jgi:hypothetical protein